MILSLFIAIPLFAKEGEAEALQFLQDVRHDEYNRILAEWRNLMPLRYRLLESRRNHHPRLSPKRLESLPEPAGHPITQPTKPDVPPKNTPVKTQPIPPKKPPKIP